MILKAYNFIVFYLGWVICVLTAGKGQVWTGAIVILALVATHLVIHRRRKSEILLVLIVTAMGFVIDCVLISMEVLKPAANIGPLWMSPPWMISLWALFSTTLRDSLDWLRRYIYISIPFGAIGGVSSYYAAYRLDAIGFNPNLIYSYVTIAIVWAIVTPALVYISAVPRDPASSKSLPTDSEPAMS